MHNKSSLFTILSMLCLFAFNNVNASDESELTFLISKKEYGEMLNTNRLYDFAVEKFAGQIKSVEQLDKEYDMNLRQSHQKDKFTIWFTKKTADQ